MAPTACGDAFEKRSDARGVLLGCAGDGNRACRAHGGPGFPYSLKICDGTGLCKRYARASSAGSGPLRATVLRESDVACQASTAAMGASSAGSAPALALHAPELGVAAVLGEELLVRAALDDAAVLEDEDLVGADDRRKAVRDDQRRAVARDLGELALDDLLGARVERASGLVEDKDRRVPSAAYARSRRAASRRRKA